MEENTSLKNIQKDKMFKKMFNKMFNKNRFVILMSKVFKER